MLGSEDGLYFAREVQAPPVLAQVQRADSGAVARQHEATCLRVPERQRPLAVHPLEAGVAPDAVRLQNDFRVAARAKTAAARAQFLAQLEVVENLAVEDDPGPLAIIRHRLLPARDVDDGQPRVRQAGPLVAVHAELIRTAVPKGVRHPEQRVASRRCRARGQRDDAG